VCFSPLGKWSSISGRVVGAALPLLRMGGICSGLILKEKQVELRCHLMETDFSRTGCYTFHGKWITHFRNTS
jgi:hypothetical protein